MKHAVYATSRDDSSYRARSIMSSGKLAAAQLKYEPDRLYRPKGPFY